MALLVAIVIFAIATLLAAAITYNKAMAARRAAATFTMEQALQAGMAAEALAAHRARERRPPSRDRDLKQDWAQEQPPFEIEDTGVWIQGKVEDLTGRFNLNSVVKWNPQTQHIRTGDHRAGRDLPQPAARPRLSMCATPTCWSTG